MDLSIHLYFCLSVFREKRTLGKPAVISKMDDSLLSTMQSVDAEEYLVTQDDISDIIEDAYTLFESWFHENPLLCASPHYANYVCDDVAAVLWESWTGEWTEEDMEELVDFLHDLLPCYHMVSGIPARSLSGNEYTRATTQIDESKWQWLRAIPQPKQRSPEWFQFRHQLLSASNLWKVFASEAQTNSLIYEKCKAPCIPAAHVNESSTLHWGVKYEPLAAMIYAFLFSAQVEEFGCLRHRQYPFLGASPDGIVTGPRTCSRYGRMLEIKNVVNREITGIPKEEYWIQTQIQMETFELDECDFLETRFLEYADAAAFYAANPEFKGVLLQFIPMTSTTTAPPIPVYKYMPIDVSCDEATVEEWIRNCKRECRDQGLALFNTIYWYLDQMSCVVIPRNPQWFAAAIPQIESVWKTIERERVEGYEHRAPKKKGVNVVPENIGTDNRIIRTSPSLSAVCFIKLPAEET